MTFFDTNILVYFTIDQDSHKLNLARRYIYEALEADIFFISPMVLSEYIFVLSKYKIQNQHQDKIVFFTQYVEGSIGSDIVTQAYKLCQEINFCKNINDVIHLKIAEQYCDKFVTFDSDFKKLKNHTKLDIEIIA